jgi:ADP-heptose:LPS heptosyltransferase
VQSLLLVRSLRADIAFQTIASHGTFANLLLGVTGAGTRCGFSNGRFSHLLSHCTGLDDAKHYISSNMDLLRRLGHAELKDPQGRYLPEIERRSEKYPLDGLAARYGPYAVMAVSSDPKLSFKRWSAEKWIPLSRALSLAGFSLLFVGGPADRREIAEILKEDGIRGENMAGETGFEDLAALIQGSEVVIGTDGMLLHFAAAMDKPCVGIFGPTVPRQGGPWRQIHHAVSLSMPCSPCYSSHSAKLPIHCKTQECLRFLPVEKVYQQVLNVLADPKNRR